MDNLTRGGKDLDAQARERGMSQVISRLSIPFIKMITESEMPGGGVDF